MTNYELMRTISKEELSVLLAQITFGANDYPNYIKDIYKWLDAEAEYYSKTTNPKEGLERITNIYFKNDNIFEPKGETTNEQTIFGML